MSREVPQEAVEARQLIEDPSSWVPDKENGKLRPEVHALLEELSQQIGQERTLAAVRDPSGGN